MVLLCNSRHMKSPLLGFKVPTFIEEANSYLVFLLLLLKLGTKINYKVFIDNLKYMNSDLYD